MVSWAYTMAEASFHDFVLIPILSSTARFIRTRWINPGFFDDNLSWYRMLSYNGGKVALKLGPGNLIECSSSIHVSNRDTDLILGRMLRPMEFMGNHPALPSELSVMFKEVSPLMHIASASLEEALIKAIFRQVVSKGQSQRSMDMFIRKFGDRMHFRGETVYDFPSLERLSVLSVSDLASCGLGFRAQTVKTVVQTFLETDLGVQVRLLSPELMITALQQIKGIGPWSARIAVCDYCKDWSFYPFDDLAMRTWVPKVWPSYNWPSHPKAFSLAWRRETGEAAGDLAFYILSMAPML